MKPRFEPTADGLEIIDPIERHRYRLTMGEPVSLEAASTDQIGFPIGSVVQFEASSIELPTTESILVRDSDGMMLAEVSPAEQADFNPGQYTLDLAGPLKVYASVSSSVHIYSTSESTYINFGEKTNVVLGGRSLHKRPARTVTTTADPADVMSAVSSFGSELKTTTPERAYSTLRGHPPRLEVADELVIPDVLKKSEPTIRVEVPETLYHVFVVVPLVYYLGADVVPGTNPQIATEDGYTYSLETFSDFESTTRKVLKKVFFLDTVVRTEGKTPLPLHERQLIEPELEFDLEEVYNLQPAERIKRYLDVPYDTLMPYLPNWRFETRLEPTAEYIEFLPFLANDLTIISPEKNGDKPTPPDPAVEQAIENFTRSDFVRSVQPHSIRGDGSIGEQANPPEMTTIQQSWGGIDDSEILSTTPLSAYQNTIGRTPKNGPIEIKVVCNDPDMDEELESVNSTYGTREELPFDTTVHYGLSVNDLEDVLAKDSDFLHYIGHIDNGGFHCSDGKLDAATIKTVGAKAFLLNACQSHDQGLHLVESGSIGGIVTLGDVINSGAVSVGSLIAQLLNLGFPLYGALDIARRENIVGQQYLMVGDGQATIAQSETRVPNVCRVRKNGDRIDAEITVYSSPDAKRGGVFSPHIESVDSYYVIPGKSRCNALTEEELEGFYDEALFPVIEEGEVNWSKDLING